MYIISVVFTQLFRRSSMVEQEAVNFEVTGSNPVAGANFVNWCY